jgi:hypothetical protein
MVRNVICSYKKKNPRNDPVFAMRGSMHSIQKDMEGIWQCGSGYF